MRILLLFVYIISAALTGFCRQVQGIVLSAAILSAFVFIAFFFFSVWNTQLPHANAPRNRSGNLFLCRLQRGNVSFPKIIGKESLVSISQTTINHKRGGHGPAFLKSDFHV